MNLKFKLEYNLTNSKEVEDILTDVFGFLFKKYLKNNKENYGKGKIRNKN